MPAKKEISDAPLQEILEQRERLTNDRTQILACRWDDDESRRDEAISDIEMWCEAYSIKYQNIDPLNGLSLFKKQKGRLLLSIDKKLDQLRDIEVEMHKQKYNTGISIGDSGFPGDSDV